MQFGLIRWLMPDQSLFCLSYALSNQLTGRAILLKMTLCLPRPIDRISFSFRTSKYLLELPLATLYPLRPTTLLLLVLGFWLLFQLFAGKRHEHQ